MDRYLIRRSGKFNDRSYIFYIGKTEIAEPTDDYFNDEWKNLQAFNGFEEASNAWKRFRDEFNAQKVCCTIDILPIEICK